MPAGRCVAWQAVFRPPLPYKRKITVQMASSSPEQSLMKAFPLELVDMTIDFLFDDVLSLLKCSQVCKAWIPTSRYHLSAMRIFHFGGATVDSNTVRLVGLLSHPLSTLAPAIRRVSVGAITKQSDILSLLHKIVPCSPVLKASRSLYLRAITWKNIDDASRISFVSLFTNVSELVLSNIKFGAYDDMASILASFPNLQRLYFARIQWPGGLPQNSNLTFPELRTLEVDYGCQDVLDWLRLSDTTFPRLSILHLKFSEIVTTESYPTAFAPALEHIELAFYRLHLKNLRDFEIDFSGNHELRSIHISHLALNELGLSGANPIYIGWVPKVLTTVSSPFLENLRLSIWISAVSNIDLLDWGSLKEIFLGSQFLSLRKLLVEMYGKMHHKPDREMVERRIYNELAGSRAAAILEFCWH
ncbi:hypothetical protein B0H19DRAFT_664790 [Mycena capillaripes]|nr:hypothetical protein B0H19DRAFT_664790 [Mycena capillaripes]